MPVTPGHPITDAQMTALEALANAAPTTGAPYRGLAGKPYSFSSNWLAELRRLRTNLSAINFGSQGLVSGPWPVQGLSTTLGGQLFVGSHYLTTSNVLEVSFYFAADPETGPDQSISLVQITGVQSNDPAYPFTVDQWPPPGGFPTSLTCKIKIGGNVPVRFQGRLQFQIDISGASAAATVETDFPASFSNEVVGPGTQILRTDVLDVTVAPGTYTFHANISGGGTFHYPFLFDRFTEPYRYIKISALVGTPTVTPGVHTSLEVFKIVASPPAADSGLAFGVYSQDSFGRWYTGGTNWVATIAGLWVAKTAMISTLPDLTAWLPWNPLVISGPNTGLPTGETPHEQRTQPAEGTFILRNNSTVVAAGNYVLGGGAYHYASAAGITGAAPPDWPTQPGQSVADGSVIWKCMGANLPAPARKFGLPCYPCYRENDPLALRPHHYQFWPQWAGPEQQPYFWIYRIRVNRLRAETADQSQMDAVALPDPVDVRIGCLRNGSFHQFGVYQTGQWIEALWPVFTQDALVYQCDERVDIQATLCPTTPEFGPAVNYPILAAHYNDTEALLNLLSAPP